MARDIATARSGAKVIGLGAVDVRSVESLQNAVEKCVKELGGIDFVMYDASLTSVENNDRDQSFTAPEQQATSSPRSSNLAPTP